QLFVASLIQEDRSLLDLLDADYTYVNRRLADLYGLSGSVPERGFHRVSLSNTPRGGVLTQASILTLTSRPTRTSPVMRGKWILEGLLNDPPPPPDPGVAQLDERHGPVAGETLRQQLEQHRSDPRCAGCHIRMDALGFALEDFDPLGRVRTVADGRPWDTSATLPDGTQLAGSIELKRVLRERYADQIVRGIVERLFVYALGRGLEDADECAIQALVSDVRSQGDRFSVAVEGIVASDSFRRKNLDGGLGHVP
ncbi:MAG TPA: DUF1588 domain-containing protein, partial [Pirellulaceae bacterium]